MFEAEIRNWKYSILFHVFTSSGGGVRGQQGQRCQQEDLRGPEAPGAPLDTGLSLSGQSIFTVTLTPALLNLCSACCSFTKILRMGLKLTLQRDLGWDFVNFMKMIKVKPKIEYNCLNKKHI